MAASLGWLWLSAHAQTLVPMPTGTAERTANQAPYSPTSEVSNLHLPNSAVESRLLIFLRDPNATVDPNTWFDFDRLWSHSGSAVLRPESGQQLDDTAAIMSA